MATPIPREFIGGDNAKTVSFGLTMDLALAYASSGSVKGTTDVADFIGETFKQIEALRQQKELA